MREIMLSRRSFLKAAGLASFGAFTTEVAHRAPVLFENHADAQSSSSRSVTLQAVDGNNYVVQQIPHTSREVFIRNESTLQFSEDGFMDVFGTLKTVCNENGLPSQTDVRKVGGFKDFVAEVSSDCIDKLAHQ